MPISLINWLQNFSWIFKPAMAFGLILLLFGFGWLILRKLNDNNNYAEISPENNQNNQIIVPQNLPEEKEEPKKENNSSDLPEKRNRNSLDKNLNSAPKEKQNPKSEQKTPPKKKIVIGPPQRELLAENNGTDADGILRLPIYGDKDVPKVPIPRSVKNKIFGKSLNEIKQIFIEISGDEVLGQKIAAEISDEINKSGRFVVTNKENADAALKIYVRHESDVDAPEEKMVAIIVRLVNVEGFVVYPDKKKISGWKYIGEIGKLPKRIAKDLTN